MAKLLNIETIYIESLSRRHKLSLAGKLVYPITTEFIVQWPELAERYQGVKYRGGLL
jgi:beta-1,4-N-acetylglucosaminyltransferase